MPTRSQQEHNVRHDKWRRASQAGFGLVEIMIGMAIGLLGVIVIFQTLAVGESYKRTTTSGADAQQNGAMALFSVERDLRMAGYGVNNVTLLGCTVLAYDQGPPVRNFSFVMAPVIITDGAVGAPDSIVVTYGNSDLLSTPVEIVQNMAAPDSYYKVGTRYGFNPGDLVIAGENGKDCSLAQVTGLPVAASETDRVLHDSGNYTDLNGAVVAARYNKAAGLGVTYNAFDFAATTGGRLFNIGRAPALNQYSVQNGQMVVASVLQGAAPTAIADGVVQFQAQYGKDKIGNDGVVDTWEASMPAAPTAADWTQVLALRLAVVARSGLREKANPATNLCDSTAANPTWSGGVLDISADPSWQCYRYRVFETTVPLRNMIWRPQ